MSIIEYIVVMVMFGMMFFALLQTSVTFPSHLNPCPHEDEDNCWWDASTMGNGIGDSFVVIKGNKIWLNREQ